MTSTFTFSFEELPLTILNGFSAGLVDGSAEISYNADAEWGIESISLDGFRKNAKGTYDRKSVQLDEGTPLYLMIFDRLESEWRDKVQEAVLLQLAEDRVCAAEDRADRMRDERMGAW